MFYIFKKTTLSVSVQFITAFYGVLFINNEEAAFSNYRLWESCGFVIAFLYASKFKNFVKLIIISTILGIGMIGYYIIEWKISSKKRCDNI